MNSTVQVLQPSGVLNSAQGNKIRQEIGSLLEEGAKLVLLDLQDVTFIDSSGLGALVMAFKAARTSGGQLFLCSVGDQPRMLFELTGMEQVFEVFSDQEEFNRTLASTPELLRSQQR